MDSLDHVVDADAETAWAEEIERRVADLESGKAKTVPWENVQGRISGKPERGIPLHRIDGNYLMK
jgi:putative addiction module component (TIGR02574 family)